jgi:hypothetical protein
MQGLLKKNTAGPPIFQERARCRNGFIATQQTIVAGYCDKLGFVGKTAEKA